MRKYKLKNPKGSTDPLYPTWHNMKARCYNETCKSYRDYGARGITVCNTWLNDFFSFRDWAHNNGWKPGLTIDRIDDSKGYYPDNCRYITREENIARRTRIQSNNTSGYRGVSKKIYRDGSIRWVATVFINGKNKVLGTFKEVTDAARTIEEYRDAKRA